MSDMLDDDVIELPIRGTWGLTSSHDSEPGSRHRLGTDESTWIIDKPCRANGTLPVDYDAPCDIVEMLNYGVVTGFLWCQSHAVTCGRVIYPGDGA